MMSEDPLLRELGRLAQEEKEAEDARRDERWDRLAAGKLSAEEDAALRALAATSPAAREAYEAFRPLGADFEARVAEALASELRRAASGVEPREPRSRLLPFRPASWWFAGGLAAAAAAASVLLLVVRGPATMPPLPFYSARLSGGIQALRGASGPPAGPQLFAPGSKLSFVVSPEYAVEGGVEAQALLARGAENVPCQPAPPAPPAPRPEISPQGAVRFQGTIGKDIRLPPGPERVWIVVGRLGKIPPAGELATALCAGRMHNHYWRAVSADLSVTDRPPP